MISPETPMDVLAEISHSLARIADKIAPVHKPTLDETDPFHDEGNATNHRMSQCGPRCKE